MTAHKCLIELPFQKQWLWELYHKPHPLREPTSSVEIGLYFLHCSCLPLTVQSKSNPFPAGVRVTVDIDVCTCIDQLPLCGTLATDILQHSAADQLPPNLLSPSISHLLRHSKYILNGQSGVWRGIIPYTDILFPPQTRVSGIPGGWLGLATSSKLLALPPSHIKEKSVCGHRPGGQYPSSTLG